MIRGEVVAVRRVTAKDVARLAGLSQSTVSYVLNDTPNQSIPEVTRQRVLKAAAELGYTPSAAARALRRGASESVLIVMPDVPIGETGALIIESVAEVLEPHGYTVVYRRQKDGRSLSALWHELMPAAIANFAAFPPDQEDAIEAAGIPVIGSSLDADGGRPLRMPQTAIGRLHVEHLVSRGHSRIGFAASVDPKVHEFLSRRLEGVRRECAARDLPAPVVVEVPLEVEAAAQAVRELRDRDEPVTAVSAYNDEVAFAVLAGMRARGLTAPRDLAVIGVDDIPLARFAVPPLTTVDVHSTLIGAYVGQFVLRRLRPDLDLPQSAVESAIDLILRETT